MPKQKTKKSLIKRFKISAKGKVLRGHQYTRHLRLNKSKKNIRRYKEPVALTTKQAKIVRSNIAK